MNAESTAWRMNVVVTPEWALIVSDVTVLAFEIVCSSPTSGVTRNSFAVPLSWIVTDVVVGPRLTVRAPPPESVAGSMPE